jgi:FixJ family two-component response regulator
MSNPAPTVYIVDDDPAVLKSLSRLLRAAHLNVAAFATPQEFLDRHDGSSHGCLVLDVAMPGVNGLEVQSALAARGSTIPIIFLTGKGDIPTSVHAMKEGASDFLTKPVNESDLLAAVQLAIKNDLTARQARAELDDILARLATLTPREREVLIHVVSGQLNKQIAGDLVIVESTVKVHRARVMEKLKVRSVADLVRLAERAGIGRKRR